MSKKSLFLISFALVLSLAYASYGVEPNAPKPSLKWYLPPTAMGPYAITMGVTIAVDGETPPVWYSFECTTDGTKSSGWIQGTTDADGPDPAVYTATGLTPSTLYSFKVKACDSYEPNNETSYTSTLSVKTDAVTTPPVVRLDLNLVTDNNEPNTQVGFAPFTIANSGSEVDDINGNPSGIIVDFSGDLQPIMRDDPSGRWLGAGTPLDPCLYQPRTGERLYRDLIFGKQFSGVDITVWGVGAEQDCNVTIWSYDSASTGDANRSAKWYANDIYMFDTNFMGGSASWPGYVASSPGDLYKHAYSAKVTADKLGRIAMTSEKGPGSPSGQPFAFVNALMVEPNASTPFVPTNYSYHPMPVNGAEDTPADAVLSWRKGGLSETQDVYFGTDFNDVNDADRITPLGVLVSQGQEPNTYDPYGFAGFLDLGTTYYWRIDEVGSAPDYTIFKGEVWRFKTLPHFVMDNFDSYEDNNALRNVWKDGSTNGTSSEVSVATAIARYVRSMSYQYKNNLSPYYSEVRADVNTARPNGLGEDPDWLGMGAKSLSLWFYGPGDNPVSERMYVKLTDGDVNPHTAQVNYDGCYDMNDVRDESWYEWNIALQDFVDNNDVNLSNVKTIAIGFGNGTAAASDGIVYFEDIGLYTDKRIISRNDIVAGDLNGDCAVDYHDLKIMADNWLSDCTAPDNCKGADFGPTDGIVNLFDFRDLATQWLWRPPSCDEGFTVPAMPPYSALPTNAYLPDPFRFMSGSRMTTKGAWTCRRAEIAAQAMEYEFGYYQDTPYSATTGDFNSTSNSIKVTVTDNGHTISFNCSISYPTTGSAPYPAMIGIGGSSLNNATLRSLGVAIITFPNDQVAQQINGSSRGIGLFYTMYGSSHSAGALMAWAWGVGRLIDAIEKTPACNIDPTRLAVTGCSRNGKGALAAGAFNERIKLTIPQESGSGGAASWRVSDWQAAHGQNVQTLSQIVNENVWFRANFNQFSYTATKLPFDHHMIEGLCAPRALLVIENSTMEWLGNVSTWTTGNVAHKIWEALEIPDMMGYSSVGHGDHCGFPASQQPEVTAYVQKFLVGGGTGDTNVMKCDGSVTYNESLWVNWAVPALQ